jgi:hypothetical protein
VTALTPELELLVEHLRSPDPSIRDDGAFTSLAELAGAGELDDHLVELGAAGTALLADPAVQARTFGALLLANVADRDNRSGRAGEAAVRTWLEAVLGWYAAEPDTRGWDDELGWLHAVAHGADAVGELAGSPHLAGSDLEALLGALVDRALAPTTTYWLHNEDDRVAVAMMAVLRRDELGAEPVVAAVDRLATAWRAVAGAPVPAQVDNALRLARTLHLQLSLGVRPEPDAPVAHPAVREPALRALGDALADVHWFYGRPA